MIRAISSFVIATLVLTAVALGAARGQAQVDGRVVVCVGNMVSVVTLDADGKPVEVPHFCPDMALALLAAVAGGQDTAPLARVWRPLPVDVAALSLQSRAVPAGKARGPPSLG